MVLLFVVVLGAVGCSNEDDDVLSPSFSPEATTGAGTGRVSIHRAIAEAHDAARKIELHVEVIHPADGDQSFIGEGLFSDSLVELEIDGSGAVNEAGIFGEQASFGAAFQDTEAFYEVLPNAPPWLGLSLEEASPAVGRDIAQLRELSLANPNILLELFQRVDAQGPVGPNEIEGEPMARFDIPVDMTRHWPGEAQSLADVLVEDFGIEDMEVHLWIDAGNRLRRIEERFVYPNVLAADPNVEVAITIDFGAEPVDETPQLPEESQVRTWRDLSG